MKPHVTGIALVIAASGLVLAGCPADGRSTQSFAMTDAHLQMDWGITIFQEEPCSGDRIAGGEVSGDATFGQLGEFSVKMSSAWDPGNLLDENENEFEADSPNAAGPVAPVLGQGDYPHDFQFDPFTQTCLDPGESVASATGEVRLTAANGDELYGLVAGGETHRLDFVIEGDGIETFNIVWFDGGTGQFTGATGSFVVHTIFRFDHGEGEFVLDLAEVLPGGTITF